MNRDGEVREAATADARADLLRRAAWSAGAGPWPVAARGAED